MVGLISWWPDQLFRWFQYNHFFSESPAEFIKFHSPSLWVFPCLFCDGYDILSQVSLSMHIYTHIYIYIYIYTIYIYNIYIYIYTYTYTRTHPNSHIYIYKALPAVYYSCDFQLFRWLICLTIVGKCFRISLECFFYQA